MAGTPLAAAAELGRHAARGRLSELTYRFELELESSPERLWPLVSDTDRFNHDAGVPVVVEDGVGPNGRRRLSLTRFGVPIEWEEDPFEWVRPHRFGVFRRYPRGPLASMRVTVTLAPREGGGTHLVYEVRAQPRNLAGRLAAAVEIGVVDRRRFTEVLRRYDAEVKENRPTPIRVTTSGPRLAPAARARLDAARRSLSGGPVDPLLDLVQRGDELSVSRLRPYALADAWGSDRREALELCLQATRQGVLELSWELLCPLCRGPVARERSLDAAARSLHCDTCLIDFDAELDRSVEATFRPVPAIREVANATYCVAGPQVTPHVAAQQLLPAGATRSIEPELEPGGYRLRTLGLDAAVALEVGPGGAGSMRARLTGDGWETDDQRLAPSASLTLENASGEERLLVLERTAWIDDAATAADVTALQVYRDLFAAEALRPGEPLSVGTLTVVFTDLLGSTRYYRDVGDAPAFGSVLGHIDQLKRAVAVEGGAVVKSMGDAIMAVFPRPVAAVRAMLAAQASLEGKPLALKVGIHSGPSIAVNQNGVLDYFGSTVNLASRLVSLSNGGDLVVSDAVLADPELAELGLEAERFESEPKGFEGEPIVLWRVRGPVREMNQGA
jgi:class 3 adenylate cyclase